MNNIELYIYFMLWIVFYYAFNLILHIYVTPVNAIPIINITNPYYERHLKHMGES